MTDRVGMQSGSAAANWYYRYTALRNDIEFYVLGVGRIPTDMDQMWRYMRSREISVFLIVLTVILGAIPAIAAFYLDRDRLVFSLIAATAPIVVTYLTYVRTLVRLLIQAMLPDSNRPVKVVSFVNTMTVVSLLMLGALLLAPTQTDVFNGQAGNYSTFQTLLPYLALLLGYSCIAEICHYFCFRFLIPVRSPRWKELTDADDSDTEEEEPIIPLESAPSALPIDQITIGKSDVVLSKLQVVEAQGNYVRLITDDGHIIERIPFSKAVKTLPRNRGIQVHRSRWIAFRAIKELKEDDSGILVTMLDGTRINVAKSRIVEVQSALSHHKPAVKAAPPSQSNDDAPH